MNVFLIAWLAVWVGCGTPQAPPQQPVQAHLQKLAVFFGLYASQNQGKTPPDEAAFKKFIQATPANELAAMGVTNVDELFVSPRDNQPYVVRYGMVPGPPGPGGAPVVAYEKTGSGGSRYVATSLGGVEELDATQFQQQVPSP